MLLLEALEDCSSYHSVCPGGFNTTGGGLIPLIPTPPPEETTWRICTLEFLAASGRAIGLETGPWKSATGISMQVSQAYRTPKRLPPWPSAVKKSISNSIPIIIVIATSNKIGQDWSYPAGLPTDGTLSTNWGCGPLYSLCFAEVSITNLSLAGSLS